MNKDIMEENNNTSEVNRRGFFKSMAFMGATFMLPSGIDKIFAAAPSDKTIIKNKAPSIVIPERRILGTGKAAMEVSALGFGVMGMNYNRSQSPDKKQCIKLIHSAVEKGVTLFDTAIVYGPLINEEFAGEALRPFKGQVAITTKFGHEVINGKATGRQDSSRKTVRQYCEESLRRLKVEAL